MNLLRTFALAAFTAAPLVLAATPQVSADTTDKKPAASEADIRAKEADCSKQADEKKLHGEARKQFRAACKKK